MLRAVKKLATLSEKLCWCLKRYQGTDRTTCASLLPVDAKPWINPV